MALTAASAKSRGSFEALFAERSIGFKWRIALAYCALLLIVGALLALIVDVSVGRAVRAQIDRRLTLASGELGDIAATYAAAEPGADLRPLAERYARYDGVAYVFIE